MRYTLTIAVALSAVLACAPADSQESLPPRQAATAQRAGSANIKLDTAQQRASYALGWDVGRNTASMFREADLATDLLALLAGFRHGFANEKPAMSEQQCVEILAKVGEEAQARQLRKQQAQGAKNAKAAAAFFAKNKARKGVTTLPSGLQYEVIRAGSGAKPTKDQQVTVHYHGTLLDGTVFDSSVQREEPLNIGVTQVIPGWQEALQLMPEGAKWKVFIPSDLAYGKYGSPPVIGPDAALIFEVELLRIQ